ncbi:MAG: peroxidase-related enzyme, partial [Paracoccaceae bacterium]|nr:peroxidase-related enzyme [Paracoccaceae bacterium]
RIRMKNRILADQLASNYRKADITPRQRAMLDFALKVSARAQDVDEADYAALHAHGLTDEDIWDIGAITAFFGLSNRLVNMASIRANEEFFSMGR